MIIVTVLPTITNDGKVAVECMKEFDLASVDKNIIDSLSEMCTRMMIGEPLIAGCDVGKILELASTATSIVEILCSTERS